MSKNRDIDNQPDKSQADDLQLSADNEASLSASTDGGDDSNPPKREQSVAADDGQPNKGLDWSTETLMNHPEGIDAAIAENNELMLKKTKDVIENGSLEDIAAALEENTRQLQMLHDRMQNLFKIMS